MNAQDILKLVDAGFTRQEIMALAGGQLPVADVPAADPDAAVEPVPAPELDGASDPGPGLEDPPKPTDPPAPAEDPYAARFEAIDKTLNNLTKALQAAAIRSTEQPEKTMSLEDAMESIIKEYQ